MNGNNIFLDSNIVIDIFAGNKSIADKIIGHSTIYISTIVLGELYVGINRVVNKTKHLNKLNSFLDFAGVLDIDHSTAMIFGEISAELYKKGKPIPTNDIWIAASVKQHQLILITNDKHFGVIDNILTERW